MLTYDHATVAAQLALARRAQGVVEGKLTAIGFEQCQALSAEARSQDALSTAAIEGERLNLDAVRSSVARRLGMGDAADGATTPRHVEGLLDVMGDAIDNASQALTHERLHGWQAALFPSDYASIRRIKVGSYRDHADAMQIVSGRLGKEVVHYQAPPSAQVPLEMDKFLAWVNDPNAEPDGLVKAAIAHLWFETIHPFEDGSGRVSRAMVDLVLARDATEVSAGQHVLRLSQQLLAQRRDYCAQLEAAQHGPLDVSPWVAWFIAQVHAAWLAASGVIDLSLAKAGFWHQHRAVDVGPRQRKAVNLLLDAGPDGFEGGMSTKTYEHLTGAARATASRDLVALAELGLLSVVGAGRGTRYYLNLSAYFPPASRSSTNIRE